MKLESVLDTKLIIANGMGNNPKAKALALLVQAAFVEELDWNMELNYRDGFIYGEFKQENGKPFWSLLTIVRSTTLTIWLCLSITRFPKLCLLIQTASYIM